MPVKELVYVYIYIIGVKLLCLQNDFMMYVCKFVLLKCT